MNDVYLEHALYGAQDAGGYRFLARSPGFQDEWLAEAERLCMGFGERPAGVACPRAVFARPFVRDHVAVVCAADQGRDDQGRPGALAFHVVVVPADLYAALGGDPFHIVDSCPPPWDARGHLSPLPAPAPPARRTVADVQKLLQVPHSATLFGGAQALLDGGRIVFERTGPDEGLVRGLWTLLPDATRTELWPASFAFGNALGFHALVTPRADPDAFATYVPEEKAGDYPEGRYELALQTAAEANDQEGLDLLFARRSYRQVRTLGLWLLAIVFFLPLAFRLLAPDRDRPADGPRAEDGPEFELAAADQFPALPEAELESLTVKLRHLAAAVGAAPEWTPAEAAGLVAAAAGPPAPGLFDPLLRADAGRLLDAVDRRLGTPDPKRRGGPLRNLGPVERQLRGLMWKHGLASYNDMSLSAPELADRLRDKVLRPTP